MDIMAVCGVGVVTAAILTLLRQYKPEYAVPASAAAGIVILSIMLSSIIPLVRELKDMFSTAGMNSNYAQVLLKALGVCFITQLACDVCRDAGENAVASKLEMSGKVAVLLMSFPLFKNLLDIVVSLIGVR
ncbi:MAG: stage III sporulation protein AD [Oscillospiraceae bacterium]|nr:stage III sporulation protein AD [Oscillospiraceae bacterium]